MKKIVIIDDDLGYLDELSDALMASGYVTIPVFEEIAAIEVIKKLQPSVILLDLKLKHQSGFSIAIELSNLKETKNIPIIAMTGFFAKKECDEMSHFCNVKKILYKPISPADMILAIEDIV